MTLSGNVDARAIARKLDPDHPQTALTPEIMNCECPGELRAGLLLINGDWSEAHQACQILDTPLAAHWHALVHRHEPDFTNSKYWLRKVGDSPIYPDLVRLAGETVRGAGAIQNGRWDPFLFTDLFDLGGPDNWTWATDRQEMLLLLEYSMTLAE